MANGAAEIIRNPFVVLGHASEILGAREHVPPGCMFVVVEECGVSGTLPDFLYKVFSEHENRDIFMAPEQNRQILSTIFKKPIRIYIPGQSYPNINYFLFNDDEAGEFDPKVQSKDVNVFLSGVQPLPLADGSIQIDETSEYPANLSVKVPTAGIPGGVLKKIYTNSIFPNTTEIDAMVDEKIAEQRGTGSVFDDVYFEKAELAKLTKISQAALFETPGIYYMFLCRTIENLENDIRDMLELAGFTEEELGAFDEPDEKFSFNTPGSILDWIHAQERPDLNAVKAAALQKAKERLEPILRQRRASRAAFGIPEANSPGGILLRLLKLPDAERARLMGEIQSLITAESVQEIDSHNGYTPLLYAAAAGEQGLIDQILTAGANPNHVAFDGSSAVHIAAEAKKEAIATALLDRGVNPAFLTLDNRTILHVAADKDLLDLARAALTAGIDPLAKDIRGDTALHLAADSNSLKVLNLLLEAAPDAKGMPNRFGRTPFHSACFWNSPEAAIAIVNSGFDINARTEDGETGIILAIQNVDEEEEEDEDDEENEENSLSKIFTILVSHGARLDDPAYIRAAIVRGKDTLGAWLIKSGAEVGDLAKLRTLLAEEGARESIKALKVRFPGGAGRRRRHKTIRLHRRGRKTRSRRSRL